MTTCTGTLPHLLLLGATGRTGRLLIAQALSQGYTITALARDPIKLSDIAHQNLTIVKGTSRSIEDLTSALQQSLSTSQDRSIVLLSTLGQTRASGSPWSATTSPPLFMADSITVLFSAIKGLPAPSRLRVQKLVIMSMFGAGDSFQNLHFAIRPVMRYSNMVQTVEDHNAIDELVKGQSDVKWVMVRSTMLKEGEKREVVVRSDDGVGEGWMPSSVTVASVVDFILRTVVSDEWDGRTPVIMN